MNLSRLLEASGDLDKGGFRYAMSIVQIVLFFVVVVCAIIMIITTLMQSNDGDGGLDVVTGAQESYYSQNKGSSRDGKLKIITIVMAVIMVVCIIAYLIIMISAVNLNG